MNVLCLSLSSDIIMHNITVMLSESSDVLKLHVKMSNSVKYLIFWFAWTYWCNCDLCMLGTLAVCCCNDLCVIVVQRPSTWHWQCQTWWLSSLSWLQTVMFHSQRSMSVSVYHVGCSWQNTSRFCHHQTWKQTTLVSYCLCLLSSLVLCCV